MPKKKPKPPTKFLNIRLPRDVWVFLKRASMYEEKSMNTIIVGCVKRYKKRYPMSERKRLTDDNTKI